MADQPYPQHDVEDEEQLPTNPQHDSKPLPHSHHHDPRPPKNPQHDVVPEPLDDKPLADDVIQPDPQHD